MKNRKYKRKQLLFPFHCISPFWDTSQALMETFSQRPGKDQKYEQQALTLCTLCALLAKPEQMYICYSSLHVTNQQQKRGQIEKTSFRVRVVFFVILHYAFYFPGVIFLLGPKDHFKEQFKAALVPYWLNFNVINYSSIS